jgi:hypothetical protein
VDDVLGIGTANERRWTLVDLPIPQLARRIVGRVPGEDDLPGEE